LLLKLIECDDDRVDRDSKIGL